MFVRIKLIVLIGIAAFCLAPTDAKETSKPIFNEVAADVGLNFRHYNGMNGKFFLPEIMGAGAALFDYDSDGDLDVFIVQGAVIEPGNKPESTLFPWKGSEPPRGRLFRNDLETGKLRFYRRH